MRLIDADAWIEELNQIISDEENPKGAKELAVGMIAAITVRPTAYDVDKVAAQIKKIMEDESIRFVDQAVNRSVNIVKSGGIE